MLTKKIKSAVNTSTLLAVAILFLVSAGCGGSSKSTKKFSTVELPLVSCWYKGQVAYYIQTEASDQEVARQQNVHFVARLADAITANAVDDIYLVTNFSQGNVIPSAPVPAGPDNSDPEYTPLWRVSTVTWNPGTAPHTLTSEEDVLAAQSAGLVTIEQTDIVVNCPVIFTPAGGQLPTAKLL